MLAPGASPRWPDFPEFSDLELRDQGLTWTEVAKQVDMTVSCMEPLSEGPTA